MENDVFDKMFTTVYKAYPDAVTKDSCRKFIGMLNKRHRKRYRTTFSSSESDLHDVYFGRGFIHEASEGLYQGFTYKESKLRENYVPIYQHIIEMSWISQMELASIVPVSDWMMIKTDELVFGMSTMDPDLVSGKFVFSDIPKISYYDKEIKYTC